MAYSDKDIQNWLAAHPNASAMDIASAMSYYGITPDQMASATGTPLSQIQQMLNPTVSPSQVRPIEGVNFNPNTPEPNNPAPVTPSALGNINPSSLTQNYGGYDQSLNQFVDSKGNVLTPIRGGEMNNIIGYSGVGSINGETVNINYDQNGNVVGATGQPQTINGQQVVANYSPNGQVTYLQYAGPESALQGFAPVIAMAAAAFGVPTMIGEAMDLTGAAASAAGGAVLGGGTAAATGQNIAKGALTGGALSYIGSQLGGTNPDYNFNGPTATNPTMADLTGTGGLTGLDQYAGIPTDLGMGGGNIGNVGGFETPSTNGYYDEITGKFIQDPNGPLQGPLTNETSGTNLSSMNGYTYDPNTQTWTTPDGQVYTSSTSPGLKAGGTGADLYKSAGIGAAGTLGAAGAGAAGGGLLSTLTNSPLGTAALINAGTGLVNSALTKDTINNALNTQTQAAQTAGSTLKDIYNQQLGFVQPYQQVGQQGLNAITANMPYLQHQFNAQDLAAGLAPNYDFMLQQGQMANQRAANVGGGAIGGNALQGLNQFTQNYAGNAYQNAFNNYQTQRNNIYNTLSNIAGLGQTANQQAIGAGTNYGQQQTNLTTGLAAAQAGATVAQNQNTTNLLGNLANNVTLASLLGQKQSVV